MGEVVGKIPDFTSDESDVGGIEEVKQPVVDETSEEKENPAELPAETEEEIQEQTLEEPVEGKKPAQQSEDTKQQLEIPQDVLDKAVLRATQGLRNEIVDLRIKLAESTPKDRKLIQDNIDTKQNKIDELVDINPADKELIKKVLKSEGYMTRAEAEQLSFQQTQNQVLNTFLNKYPEYKPENDPENKHWNSLLKEFSVYATPKDPAKIADLLERSHKAIAPVVVRDQTIPVQKRAIKVASAGAGGVQRSSSSVNKTFSPEQRLVYQQGGWSEEEINEMENRLEE